MWNENIPTKNIFGGSLWRKISLRHSRQAKIRRDEKTSMKEFCELIEEITTLMTFECLKEGVPTVEREVNTPLETCTQRVIKDNSIVIVPILRASLGMVNGVHVLLPSAKEL